VIQIDSDCVIGRDPQSSNAATRGLRPIRIDDPSGQMSRAHFEIRVFNGELLVVDRNSLNGLLMRDPDAQEWTRLTPWQPVAWQPGTALQVGGRTMYLHTPGTPLPSQRPKAYAQPSMSR
jgi:RND superfamily putative drug exporter